MKTKYVSHGLNSMHVNFHDNRTMRTVILVTKNCRWGGRKKSRMGSGYSVDRNCRYAIKPPHPDTFRRNLIRID